MSGRHQQVEQRQQRQEEIDHARDHHRERKDRLRHRQLLDQAAVGAQAVHRRDDALREEIPEQQAGENVDRVVLDVEAEDGAEGDVQDAHHQHRLEHRPGETDQRAAVAHPQLTMHELGD